MQTDQKKCDLHIHSTYSDSDATVEDIFKQAKKQGLCCIAISDHDTVDGIEEAKILSKVYDIELIEAVEVSAYKEDVEIHVLGYLIDSKNSNIKQALASIRELRKKRLVSMAEKLNSLGLKIDIEELFSKIKDTIPTRLHLGLYLVKKGFASSLGEVFSKYLSPGKPAYIARIKYTVEEAVKLIKDSGGLAFLAHPHLLNEQSWIEEFVSYGIDGLEIVYPRLSKTLSGIYKAMADKFGLLKSGGSDAHGSYKEFTQIGGVTVPYQWVEEMKKCKEMSIS
jgi:predicted metal-dependent phosphoesterase TrpH